MRLNKMTREELKNYIIEIEIENKALRQKLREVHRQSEVYTIPSFYGMRRRQK